MEAKTEQLDDRTLCNSLRGVICPACGKAKRRAETLCFADYRRLPKPMQFALYRRIGNGYAEAVAAALQFLGVTAPHFPAAGPGKPETPCGPTAQSTMLLMEASQGRLPFSEDPT